MPDLPSPSKEFRDAQFRKLNKNKNWKIVEPVRLPSAVADTHAHIQMLDEPGLAIARAAAHDVGFIEAMVDPTSAEEPSTFDHLDEWMEQAERDLRNMVDAGEADASCKLPAIRIALGVHPHDSKDWTDQLEANMLQTLKDSRVSAVGEIGLDYHYDMSERDVQKRVFARQVQIAHEAGLPVLLHVREAFDDAFEIMEREGWPEAGTLLHCYTHNAEEVRRWVDAGCFIAFGGALTFSKSDEIREALKEVSLDRLLLETDAPFMTPVPLRGQECEPAHVIWTAEFMCRQLNGETASEPEMTAFFEKVYQNSLVLLDRAPTAWQKG